MATRESSPTPESRRAAMTCPFCKEIYAYPKFLPCLHTICFQCLGALVIRHHAAGAFPCPQCQADIPIPPGGAAEFTDNFYLRPLELERERTKITCFGHPGVIASFYCADCDEPMCMKCVIIGHKMHETKDLHLAILEARQELQNDRMRAEETVACLRSKIAEEARALAVKAAVEKAIRKKHAELVAMADKYRDDMLAALEAVTTSLDTDVSDLERQGEGPVNNPE